MVKKILNPGAMGDGLRHSYNQGRDDDKPQNAPQATGLNPDDDPEIEDKSFVSRYPDGNLYNTENDRPVRDNPPMLEPGSNRTETTTREQTDKMLMKIKLGDNLSWRGGEGTVVARENMYVKIADNNDHRIDTVPVSETYFKDDILATSNVGGMLWDKMQHEQRMSILNKAHILEDSQKAFLYRDWLDIPEDTREIIKESNYFDGVPHGGVEGREPSHNDRNDESMSHRDVTQPKHVTAPYTDKQAPAFQKDKSDVEHGVYGGVVTDTPIDATDEYEDDRPKKPLSGAQTAINEGPTGQTGAKRTVGNEPSDPTKAPGIHQRWSETRKDLDLASITGEGKKKQIGSYPSGDETSGTSKKGEEPSDTPSTVAGTMKDEDRGVAESSAGFQGAKPNAQSQEKSDLDLASITGEGKKDKDESGTTHPDFGHGPDRNKMDKELDIKHKGNSRWGPRQVTEKEYTDWIRNN